MLFVRGTVDEGLVRIGDAFGWILLLLLSLLSHSTFEFSGSVDGEIDSRFSMEINRNHILCSQIVILTSNTYLNCT